MLQVKFSRQAQKFLKKADSDTLNRILDKISKLKKEPIGHDTKPVKGFKEKLYRVRVGDYRILYEVDHDDNIIGIVKIDKRERAY